VGNYLDLIFHDCHEDLSNPSYAKQAGLLWATAVTASVRTFTLQGTKLLQHIRTNINSAKSDSHKKDLIALLGVIFDGRANLVESWLQVSPGEQIALKEESPDYLNEIWYKDLAPLVTDITSDGPIDVLVQAFRASALLARQQSLPSTGGLVLSCSESVLEAICDVLGTYLFARLSRKDFDLKFQESHSAILDQEALLAARIVSMHYRSGFKRIVDVVMRHIQTWPTEECPTASKAMTEALVKLSFIGCSGIPKNLVTKPLLSSHQIELESNAASGEEKSVPSTKIHSALGNLVVLVRALLSSTGKPSSNGGFLSLQKPRLGMIVGLHGAFLQFQDACLEKYGAVVLSSYNIGEDDWIAEFAAFDLNERVLDTFLMHALVEDDPETYRQFLRIGLFVVRVLYRDAILAPRPGYDEESLKQLCGLASLVVRALGESLQRSCHLTRHAFGLFLTELELASVNDQQQMARQFLTQGILEGLWPGVMGELVWLFISRMLKCLLIVLLVYSRWNRTGLPDGYRVFSGQLVGSSSVEGYHKCTISQQVYRKSCRA
jgi:DNA repair/transcription protein MET18/MMS19